MLAQKGVIRRVKFKTRRVVIRRLRRAGISRKIINSLSTLSEGCGHTRLPSMIKKLKNVTNYFFRVLLNKANLFIVRSVCNKALLHSSYEVVAL